MKGVMYGANTSFNEEVYFKEYASNERIQSETFIIDAENRDFNLLMGKHYQINAQQPLLDINRKVFFTLKTAKNWTYNSTNDCSKDMIYYQEIMFPNETDAAKVLVTGKAARLIIPFEAVIRFYKVEKFHHSFSGIWMADIIYDYQIATSTNLTKPVASTNQTT